MKIGHVNFYTFFSGTFPNTTVYNDVREVPGVPCAYCGKRMLSYHERDEYLKNIVKTPAEIMQDSALKQYKNGLAYVFLNENIKKNPGISVNLIVKNDSNKKIISTFPKEEKTILSNILKFINDNTTKAPDIVNSLNSLKNSFNPLCLDILAEMEKYSKKYPGKTFSEIFNMTEVLRTHYSKVEKRKLKNDNLKEMNIQKIERIKKILPQNEVNLLQNLLKDTENLKNLTYSDKSKQFLAEKLFEKFYADSNNDKNAKTIIKILKTQFYPEEYSVSDAILHMSDMNDREIVAYIVRQTSSTFDHILPRQNGGTKELKNALYMCKTCNMQRQTTPYSLIVDYNPEFKKNIQKQIDTVVSLIRNGKLKNHEEYPADVRQTLYNLSDRKINIDISKYIHDVSRDLINNINMKIKFLKGLLTTDISVFTQFRKLRDNNKLSKADYNNIVSDEKLNNIRKSYFLIDEQIHSYMKILNSQMKKIKGNEQK